MDIDKKRRIVARRARRVRNRIARLRGERPRLSVFRSLKHLHAQIIDDDRGMTLAAASSLEKDPNRPRKGGKCAIAAHVGAIIAERARAAGIEAVVFDRGSCLYHGRIKAFAEAAREGGIDF